VGIKNSTIPWDLGKKKAKESKRRTSIEQKRARPHPRRKIPTKRGAKLWGEGVQEKV